MHKQLLIKQKYHPVITRVSVHTLSSYLLERNHLEMSYFNKITFPDLDAKYSFIRQKKSQWRFTKKQAKVSSLKNKSKKIVADNVFFLFLLCLACLAAVLWYVRI